MAFRLGLTGSIGSGKSTVAGMLQECGRRLLPPPGPALIDADRLAREAVEPGRPALAEIRSAFGEGFIAPDGRLRRRALGQRVFADRSALARLGRIVHPRVRQAELALLEELAGHPLIVLDVPLLYEADMADLVDRTLVVTISENQRFARLRRRGLGEKEIILRLGSQIAQARKAALAEDVIDNSGSLEATRRQVEGLLRGWIDRSLIAARSGQENCID